MNISYLLTKTSYSYLQANMELSWKKVIKMEDLSCFPLETAGDFYQQRRFVVVLRLDAIGNAQLKLFRSVFLP